MSRRHVEHQENLVRMSFAGTALPMHRAPAHRQMPLYPDIADRIPPVQQIRYVVTGLPKEMFLDVRQLLENTSSTEDPIALPVLKELVDALDELQLLEAIYGYADGKACRVVAIADNLPSAERDIIWKINIDFQRRHSDLDVDIRIIQRRGREPSDVYEDDGTATIVRENATA